MQEPEFDSTQRIIADQEEIYQEKEKEKAKALAEIFAEVDRKYSKEDLVYFIETMDRMIENTEKSMEFYKAQKIRYESKLKELIENK